MKRLMVCAALAAASCVFDTDLPPTPLRGKVHGAIDPQGRVPAENLAVSLVNRDGAKVSVTTGANGAFAFADLAVGSYYLECRIGGFAPLLVPFVEVKSGADTDLGTLTPTWLGGTSSEAKLRGRVSIAGGADPAGVQVEFLLQPSNKAVALVVVGAGGEFLQTLPPATYKLRGTHPLYVTTTSMDVTLAEAEDRDLSAQPLVLQVNPATVTGHVDRERDRLAPEPAAGVTVTVEPSGLTTTSDMNGNFSLGGLPPGPATVRFALAGFHDDATHAVKLEPGMPSALPPVTLALDRGTITGRVEMADGRPALGTVASVTGLPYSAQVSPESDASKASFVIDRVPVGTWEVAALRQDYSRAARSNVVVRRGEAVDIGLLTLTALQGDFVIDDGDPSNTNGYTRAQSVTLQLQGFTGAASYRASEDPTLGDAGFVAFTGPSQPFTLGASQGTHRVYAQYRDSNGTASPIFVSSIVLDSVPPAAPSIELEGGASFTRIAQPLTATVTASETPAPGVDAVAGLREIRLSEATVTDGGVLAAVPVPYQRDVSFTRPSTADGTQTVFVQFFDHAGNWSTPVSDSVTVDTAAPSGTLSIPRGAKATVNGTTNELLTQLAATAAPEPNGGFVLIRLANSAAALQGAVLQPFASSIGWFLDPTGPDGDREVWWQLQDAAGNQTAPAAATIRLDRTPPAMTTFALVGSSPTSQATVTLTTAATDNFGLSPTQGITVSEDAFFLSPGTVGPQALGASVMFPLSAGDGAKQVYARFRDGAGNESFASVRVDLDRQPPSGTFTLEGTLADGTVSETTSATANVTLAVTSQGATLYALGNESLMTCPAPGPAYNALPSNGRISTMLTGAASPREVKLCLADAAGNVTGPLLRTMALDATPPASCALVVSGTRADGNPAPAGRTARAAVTVAVSGCSETPAEMVVTEGSVTCTAPGLPWVPFQASQPFVLIGADGMHTVRACVRDAARNVFAPPAATTDLDSTAPSGASVVLDNGATWVNLQQYQARGSTFTASAAGTATGATEWSLSTTPTFTMWTAFPATSPRNFTFGATGNQRIFAAFRDDLGNTTMATVTDDITFDIAPPSVAGLSLNLVTSAPDPTFVPTATVSLQVASAPPSDAAAMFPVQVPTSTACSAATFTSPRAPSTDVVFITSGGEGQKRICLAFADAAGNLSSPLQRDFTVDTIPPAAPEIVTPPTLNNLPDNSMFVVTTARPVVETNFLRYEKQGGQLSAWTTSSTVQATTSFDFNLVSNSGLSNVPNLLQLRAIDRAGNIGPQSQVTVTTDTQPPQPPTTSLLGVSNFTQSATVFWVDSSSTDVTRYLLDYGPSSGQYTGAYATEGVSPLVVPAGATQVTLHGLVDGTFTYAQMRAIDAAGNVSSPSSEVQLQPNVKSPTVVATIDVPNMGEIIRIIVAGDVAYLVGTNDMCLFTPQTDTVIAALDLSVLKSATQSGRLTLPLPTVPVLWRVSIAEPLPAATCGQYHAQDFVVDGAWGYLSTNDHVRFVYLGRRGVAPTVSAPITLPWPVRTLALKGNTLFINGAGGMQALNLAKLYDDNASTLPALPADGLGAVTDLLSDAAPYSNFLTWGSVVVRNQLLRLPKNAADVTVWDITNPARNTPVGWTNMNLLTTLTSTLSVTSPVMVASGNLLYGLHGGRVSATKLNPLFAGMTPMTLQEGSGVTIDQLFAQGPVSVRGRDILTAEDPGNSNYFYWVDATSAGTFPSGTMSLASKYFVDPVHRMRSVAQYGNYAITGGRRGRVHFFELSTPRALRLSQTVAATTNRVIVDGAFAYGSGGTVVDLQSGPGMVHRSPEAEGSGFFCDYFDVAKVGDLLVSTKTSAASLRVVDTSDAVDRDPATLMQLDPTPTDVLGDIALPGVTRVMSIEVWGRLLAVTELRADGIWLEVFDASKLRDSETGLLSPMTDTRGAVRLTTYTGPNPGTDLQISHGRAFVTVWDGCCGGPGDPSPSLFAVDLRGLVDDDATTTGLLLQGSLAVTSPRDLAISGNRAYVTRDAMGIEVWDISRAMDDDPATLLNATMPLGQFFVSGSGGSPRTLTVAGTMVYATNNSGTSTDARTYAIDFSNLASPRIVSQADISAGGASCAGVSVQGGIALTGSKLYLGGYQVFHELELE